MIEASIIERLNRFTLLCRLNGRPITAYLPNPGRLWELLLPGRTVYLRKSKGKIPYTVWAVNRDGIPVLLHTHYTTKVAEKMLQSDMIPGLEGYSVLRREVNYGGHRFDFLIEKGQRRLLLEVKSCTLFGSRIAMFPDAVTLRGRRHVEVLGESGGGVLFLVHAPHPEFFLPDFHTDPQFSDTLYRYRRRLLLKAVALRWDTEPLECLPVRELSIPWHVYEMEARDRGAYLLVFEVRTPRRLKVGSLGEIDLQRGHYIYVGSAMNSLVKRINRHLRRRKRHHWHIDTVLSVAESIRPIPIRASEALECLLSKEVSAIADGVVQGVGSSDCKCKGHLYWMRSEPMRDERFISIILKYRIERLNRFLGDS